MAHFFVDFKHSERNGDWYAFQVLVFIFISTTGGQTILPGAPVSVKWLEEWYEGEILEMGRQKDLFKVDIAVLKLVYAC